jgi:HEXXH motif-containing protein
VGLKEFLEPAGAFSLTQALAMQRAQVRLARFDDAVQRLPRCKASQELKRLLDCSDAARRFALASRPEFHRFVRACEAGDTPAADLEQPLFRLAAQHPWDEAPAMPARLVDDRPSFKNPFDDGNRPLVLDFARRKTLQTEIERAFAFIESTAPDAAREMVWTAPYLSPIEPNAGNQSIPSFSSQDFPGVIFIGLFRGNGQMTDWRHLSELIFHEHLHNRLYLLDELLPMATVDGEKDIAFYSPWKKGPRPLNAILHSLYVFSHLAWFWAHVLGSSAATGIESFADARRREHLLSLSQMDIAAIQGVRSLTECGRALVEASLNAAKQAKNEPTEQELKHAA